MPSRHDRKKASELFNESEPYFGRKASFKEVFPEIEEVVVAVEELRTRDESQTPRVYGKDSLGEYIDCTNPLCYNGGFSIGSILRSMVRKKETQLEATAHCQGYEGSKRRKQRCLSSFKVKVRITYQAATAVERK